MLHMQVLLERFIQRQPPPSGAPIYQPSPDRQRGVFRLVRSAAGVFPGSVLQERSIAAGACQVLGLWLLYTRKRCQLSLLSRLHQSASTLEDPRFSFARSSICSIGTVYFTSSVWAATVLCYGSFPSSCCTLALAQLDSIYRRSF